VSVIKLTAPPDGQGVYVRAEWVMGIGAFFTFDTAMGQYARNLVMAGGQTILVEDTDANVFAAVNAMDEGATTAGIDAVAEADALRGVR
jgi:hypothetical protein